jgi:glycosyltransferase involved in cell wall biosynthesis
MTEIAIIVQRYGLEVNGGAELHARYIAERLAKKYDVEIITTCALEYDTWANYYKPGIEEINGVKVHRFLTDKKRSKDFPAFQNWLIKSEKTSRTDGDYQTWIDKQGPYCPKLVDYVLNHRDDYDVFILMTYLYYTTVMTMPIVKKKAILIPTAHDEIPIYFDVFKNVFSAPRIIAYNTEEERLFVQNLFQNKHISNEIIGLGIDVPEKINIINFRNKYSIGSDYMIYVGRIDIMKGCDQMFDFFIRYKNRNKNSLKLVLMGKAYMNIPNHNDIVNLGFVSDKDKFDGIGGAKICVMPSRFESLSITTLEAMSLGIPVVVNGHCDVLAGHCTKSNGGLYYKNYFEFEGIVNYLLEHTKEYSAIASNGKKYAYRNYRWNTVMSKFDRVIKFILGNLKIQRRGNDRFY